MSFTPRISNLLWRKVEKFVKRTMPTLKNRWDSIQDLAPSNIGVCITELVDGMVNVVHAEEYPRPDFNEMIKTTVNLLDKYDIRFDNSCRIFVDAANPSFISTLKQAVNEDPDYTKQIQYASTTIHQLQFFSSYNKTCL